MLRKIVMAFGDTHGGHKLGLMCPEMEFDGENGKKFRPRLTDMQRYLWYHFTRDVDKVRELAQDTPVVIIHEGDACQGDKYPTELVSTRKSDQIKIAVAMLVYVLNHLAVVKKVRLVLGTGAHGFGEGSAEELICDQLQAQFPQLDIATLAHGLAEIEGVGIDYAHHGPNPGTTHWTSGNAVRSYVRSIVDTELAQGRRPPRIILRAHHHNLCWETYRTRDGKGGYHVCDGIVLPAYCGLGEHGRQATRSRYLISTGVVAIEAEDGDIADHGIHTFSRSMDVRRREQL